MFHASAGVPDAEGTRRNVEHQLRSSTSKGILLATVVKDPPLSRRHRLLKRRGTRERLIGALSDIQARNRNICEACASAFLFEVGCLKNNRHSH